MREIKFRVWDVLNKKMLNWGEVFHLPVYQRNSSECEVIGNIYENPEILEEQ